MTSGNVELIRFILAAILIAAVIIDLKERRIPNWLTLPSLLLGLALQTTHGGAEGFITGLTGAGAGAALLTIPFFLGWMGGGDMKLLAAVGAFMGAPLTILTLLFACAAAGLMAAGWLAVTGNLVSSIKHIFLVWLPNPTAKPAALATSIPFGPALALGALAAVVFR